jgi:hypothetical protein
MRRACWASNRSAFRGRGLLQGVLHGLGGDFVELDTTDPRVLAFDQRGHVPGNGFAFAVRVGGEVDVVGFGGRVAEIGHDLFLAFNHLVLRGEVVRLRPRPMRAWWAGRARGPREACTIYLLPRNLRMVLTLAGDSTMIRSLPITCPLPQRTGSTGNP